MPETLRFARGDGFCPQAGRHPGENEQRGRKDDDSDQAYQPGLDAQSERHDDRDQVDEEQEEEETTSGAHY